MTLPPRHEAVLLAVLGLASTLAYAGIVHTRSRSVVSLPAAALARVAILTAVAVVLGAVVVIRTYRWPMAPLLVVAPMVLVVVGLLAGPVLTLGGFTGSSDAPNIARLDAFVAAATLRYLALTALWTGPPTGTPPSQRHHRLAATIDRARSTGCPISVGPVCVIDVTDHRCHASSVAAG